MLALGQIRGQPASLDMHEDLNEVLEDVMRSSRRKRDCQTPSKKNAASINEITEPVASGSGTRRRTSRHCAEQAREKITTLFNVGDKYGRSMYAVSEDGTSDDSSEASFKPTIDDDEVMPKGEYGAASEDEDIVNTGADIFGFKTPKRKSTMRTPLKTPTSVSKQRLYKTPNKTPLKTPDKVKVAQTPQTVRRQLRNKIVKVTAQVLDECTSDAEVSESESSSEDEEDNKKLQQMKAKAAKNQVDISANTEDYFLAQSSSVHTSDRTLNRLKNPRLNQETVDCLMQDVNDCHIKEKQLLMKDYQQQFPHWSFLLNEGFNILVYGLGSKRYLLDEFRTRSLNGMDVLVVNGYFPGLTIKEIFTSLIEGILEYSGSGFSGPIEQLEFIEQQFSNSDIEAFMIIHNMDGPSLQFSREQEVLGRLAAIPNLHVIASVDHINTPLLWDQRKLSQSRFVFLDCTTFAPYTEEISYENSLLVQQTSTLGLASLVHVFASLTFNAKAIFILIAQRQLDSKDDSNYHGFPFHELYNECRDRMLVNSDLTLRAQLTEFKDHKLLRMRRTADGTEVLHIPLENHLLEEFVQKHEDET
uniref:Origin recognition complex subunit 2 n=1 Tax=Eubosmina coregoni TaxID=186181 RepID=A0A4Y7LQ05_9CRUS|nr:EOG090X0AVI [Eubosmina coregoni]SVE69982.1 EOG090X0AVI [Eubosmina coregoni]